QVEYLAVELGFGADHFEVDLLAEVLGEIADDAGQFLPRVADRLHARAHDRFLELRGHRRQALQGDLIFRILLATRDLDRLGGRRSPRHWYRGRPARARRARPRPAAAAARASGRRTCLPWRSEMNPARAPRAPGAAAPRRPTPARRPGWTPGTSSRQALRAR